jgi:ribA/ribD-fused uncharacterized protein
MSPKTDMFGTPVIDSFRDDYRFLSNFYVAPVSLWGINFPSSEHAYQWAKTDDELEKKFVLFKQLPHVQGYRVISTSPGQAKRVGKTVTKREDWDLIRPGIMLEILRAKFSQNPDLKELLLATGDAILIEGNTWHDNDWGHCTCENCITKKKSNMLGALLMQVREELQNERQD